MKFNVKTYLLALTVIVIVSALNSCKKNTVDTDQALIDFTDKLKGQPVSSVEMLRIKGTSRYEFIPSANGVEGSSCPDPGDSEYDHEFYSMVREFTCNVGYRFLVTYKIISEFYPVYNVGANLSTGKVQLRNGTTPVHVTQPTAVIDIINNGVVGQNSNGDDLNEFLVTFRSDVVSEAIYNQSNQIRPSLYCYTDCVNYTLSIGFSTQQSTVGSQHTTQPCLRVDKMYWAPAAGGSPPNIQGCNASFGGCFPGGYVFPDIQEVEFQNGSGQWKNFYIYQNGMANPSVESIGIVWWHIKYLDMTKSQNLNGLVPGWVNVRYRNNHSNVSQGGPCVTQPTGSWVNESWFLQ